MTGLARGSSHAPDLFPVSWVPQHLLAFVIAAAGGFLQSSKEVLRGSR
jgi:hypothetical protein